MQHTCNLDANMHVAIQQRDLDKMGKALSSDVDLNKGDNENPNYESRLVVKEIRRKFD